MYFIQDDEIILFHHEDYNSITSNINVSNHNKPYIFVHRGKIRNITL